MLAGRHGWEYHLERRALADSGFAAVHGVTGYDLEVRWPIR